MRSAIIVSDVKCPKCGAEEMKSPTELNIRAYKVCDSEGKWWSQCLRCADDKGKGGWFRC